MVVAVTSMVVKVTIILSVKFSRSKKQLKHNTMCEKNLPQINYI